MRHALVLMLALVAALGMLLPSSVGAQNAGVLEGQVVQGTPEGAAPGVTLLRVRKFRGTTEVGAVDSSTDAQGRFRIEGLEVNKDLRYYVEAGYQNVAYRTDPLDLTALSGSITLTVYDSTTSDEAIRIDTVLVEFSQADARTGFIGVSERVTIVNTGSRTFVGDLFTNPATGRSLRLPLPLAALDIRLGHGFGPDGVLPTSEGMASRTPVTPGETVLLFGYDLPYQGTAVSMEHAWAYPVTDLFVLVPEGAGTPASPTLTQAGRVSFEGNAFLVLQGAGLAPGAIASIGVEGLPPIQVAKVFADTVMRVAATAMLGAIVLGVAAYAATARRRRGGAYAQAPLSPLAEERGRLVGALADLDDAQDTGRVSQAEHEQARASGKRRLVEVMLLLEEESPRREASSA